MSALTLTQGWVCGIRHLPSGNQAPRPPSATVVLAVVHGISLPPREFGGDAVLQLFTNTLDCKTHPYYERLRGMRVSAHFFIRRDGEMVQFVATDCAAWHAGASTWRGNDNCNDFSIGIELEGCDDIAYTDSQYEKLALLLEALREQYPALAVVGHCHIAPQRKSDPGAAFDWQKLFQRIGTHYDGRSAA